MSATTPPIAYDHAQVSRWFDANTFNKALPYVRSVSDMHWDAGVLRGMVQGSAAEPYEVVVMFHRETGHTEVEGDCSCPVGVDCKHVVALLLASLRRQPGAEMEVSAELMDWLERLRGLLAAETKKAGATQPSQRLIYALERRRSDASCRVKFFKASFGADGSLRSVGDSWTNVEGALRKQPRFVDDNDLAILRLLWIGRDQDRLYNEFLLKGTNGAAVLERMVATGRLFISDIDGPTAASALRSGAPRPGNIQWQVAEGRMLPEVQTAPPSTWTIVVDPVWYIDQASGEAGSVALPWGAKRISEYLTMPPLSPAEAPLVAAVLREIAPDLPPPPVQDAAVRVIDSEPTPVLQLDTLPVRHLYFGDNSYKARSLDHASVRFDYEGVLFDQRDAGTLVRTQDGEMIQVKRRADAEKRRLAELRKAGLKSIPSGSAYGPRPFPSAMMGMYDREDWTTFMQEALPRLRKAGWRIDMTPEFSFNVVEIDAIEGSLRQADDGWFDLEMGIVVHGRTLRLAPLLSELFFRDHRWLAGGIDMIADSEAIILKTDQGERLSIRAERLKPLVRVLIDLFQELGGGALRLSRFDAGRIAALEDTGRWEFHGDESVRDLARSLKNASAVGEVAVPKGLRAELRPYQRQGLSWMQFLLQHHLAGVLADDMGLGKTVQTLAHLLAEKEAGRLDKPALIVVPTSLVPNWKEEARRFAPALRVLSLHGAQRKERFDDIPQHDLILTTYALLWRDQEALSKHGYHLLILDEAQMVKNTGTKAAAAIRRLNASHRLCLTGTPLENHLGELWSLFDFLLPGFLGSQKDFTRRWRTPIEKEGDMVRRDLLARRIRPFMLRRRKDEVARELPPKTVIVRSVGLDGEQRDLYETVRAAMQRKVRAAIAAKGMDGSHIVVLDALLKLRQVCCDPRLVRLSQAKGIKESAKLELLLRMLVELIEEGRRILLFSQFTGMLDLIAAALDEAGIGYVMLTGDTADRAAPVRRFQEGKVPLFLISLKAGGVGLNLTAADTVIHYDPWWNPAAENQATDRAHRLGQDKPVFVYKLIAAGSIEEKIVALQERKAALAAGILSEDGAAAVKFSAEELDALFEPMPEIE